MKRLALLILALGASAACGVTEPTNAIVNVSVSTTGDDVDDAYVLDVDDGLALLDVAGNDAFALQLPAGTHSFELTEIEPNCEVDGSNPVMLTLEAGDLTSVAFNVICEA